MENINTLPMVKQESLPNEGITNFTQLNANKFYNAQRIQNAQSFNLQAFQQNLLRQQPPMPANQLTLANPMTTGPIIDGKVLVDSKFLQCLISQNKTMNNQIKALLAQREQLFESLKQYDQKSDSEKQNSLGLEKINSEKKKRFRRTAKDISRMYKCPTKRCSKSYGSEGSLHQHIRLKHPTFDIINWIQSRISTDQVKDKALDPAANSNEVNSCSGSYSVASFQNIKQEKET